MAKRGLSGATPELRFPRFARSGGWTQEKLSDVASFVSEKVLVSTLNLDTYVSTENLLPDYGQMVSAAKLPDVSSVTRFECNDILISNIRPYLRKVWRSDRSGGASNDVVVVRAKGAISEAFLAVALRNDAFIAYVMSGAKGVKMPRGDTEAIREYPFAYPTPAEQQRIAECLTALDDVIVAQGRKVEELKAHKRGLMQQLFPRGGETRPRLRFPKFRNAGDWKVEPAAKFFLSRKEKGEPGLPIYSVTMNDGMIPRASFERDFYDIEDPSGNKKVHAGDIVYNTMRMWQGAQGVASEDCMVSPAYVVLSPKAGVCSSFFCYLFKLRQSLELLTAYSRGLTEDRLRLYFDDFSQVPLCVPGPEEQKRIADCLSSVDMQIAAESSQLAALKSHKLGLMQRLFPALEGH